MTPILTFILLTNLARAQAHMPALTENITLDHIAQDRAAQMCDGNISHAGFLPAFKNHPEFIAAGENISYNYRTPEEITQAFLNSPTHKENMLSIIYQQIGIGTCGKVVVVEYGRER